MVGDQVGGFNPTYPWKQAGQASKSRIYLALPAPVIYEHVSKEYDNMNMLCICR